MDSITSYRVVAVSADGQRMILDESLDFDRADQMRTLLVELKAYAEIIVEPDVADGTRRLTVNDGGNTETVAFSE
jgi:hypothetical protein